MENFLGEEAQEEVDPGDDSGNVLYDCENEDADEGDSDADDMEKAADIGEDSEADDVAETADEGAWDETVVGRADTAIGVIVDLRDL